MSLLVLCIHYLYSFRDDSQEQGMIDVRIMPSPNTTTHEYTHTHTHSIRNLFLYYEDKGSLLVIPVMATVYMGLLFLFVIANFFLCSFVDPGIYPRGEQNQSLTNYTIMFSS